MYLYFVMLKYEAYGMASMPIGYVRVVPWSGPDGFPLGSVFVVLPRPTIIDSDEIYLVVDSAAEHQSRQLQRKVVCLLRNVIMKCSRRHLFII